MVLSASAWQLFKVYPHAVVETGALAELCATTAGIVKSCSVSPTVLFALATFE